MHLVPVHARRLELGRPLLQARSVPVLATAPDSPVVYKGSRRKIKVFALPCNGEAGKENPAAEFRQTPGE